jgi:erythrin-vacuolar iron transport family protein
VAKAFSELSEREVLALAISLEEEDARIYGDFAERLKPDFPDTAKMLKTMQDEELAHAQRLAHTCRAEFGEHIPFIKRQDVKGFLRRKPLWLAQVLSLRQVRKEVEVMELESMRFYQAAARRAANQSMRKLLNELAVAEQVHKDLAANLRSKLEESGARRAEDQTYRRMFVLQVIQPGLAGLMDGSVSTLAPVFAAAFATRDSWDAFLVGMAASIGAGISMGFAEALSDDGVVSGRRTSCHSGDGLRAYDDIGWSRPHVALPHDKL